jgi:hypothetical protein
MTAAFIGRRRGSIPTPDALAPPYDSDRGVCRELRNHARLSHKAVSEMLLLGRGDGRESGWE